MGHFRFHRSLGNKFFRLNVSKSGFSVSGGVPGAHINVPLSGSKKRKPMVTVGLPGSGLSYRQTLGSGYRGAEQFIPFHQELIYVIIGIAVMVTAWALFS